MYTKQCALGHSPLSVVRVPGSPSVFECPACQAQYTSSGTSWIQISPSLILNDDRRFKSYIEDRREDLALKLSEVASESLDRSSSKISDSMRHLSREIGGSITDASRIQAEATLLSKLWEIRKDEELQTRQHIHEERLLHSQHQHQEKLLDKYLSQERELQAQNRSLKLFELAFKSLDMESQRQIIEAAFRVSEHKASTETFKRSASQQVQQDEGLKSLESEVQSISNAIEDSYSEHVSDARTNILTQKVNNLRATLKRTEDWPGRTFSPTFKVFLVLVVLLAFIFGSDLYKWIIEYPWSLMPQGFFRYVLSPFLLAGEGIAIAIILLGLWTLWWILWIGSGLINRIKVGDDVDIRYDLRKTEEELNEAKEDIAERKRATLERDKELLHNRIQALRTQLLAEAARQTAAYDARMQSWRDELLNSLQQHHQALSYQLSDLFGNRSSNTKL